MGGKTPPYPLEPDGLELVVGRPGYLLVRLETENGSEDSEGVGAGAEDELDELWTKELTEKSVGVPEVTVDGGA